MIQPIRTATLAAALLAVGAPQASAQRGGGSRGIMTVPRAVTPPRITTAPAPRSPYGGSMTGPRMSTPGSRYTGPRAPRAGDLPRLTTGSTRRGYGTASTFNNGYGGYRDGGYRGSPRYRRAAPVTRWGVGSACGSFCVNVGARFGSARFRSSFLIGWPFAVPVFVPYPVSYGVVYAGGGEASDEYVERGSQPASSKLIVVGGGTGGGGDALTVESLGDSVRLSWLASGRAAREVKLFVADSAHRELATRAASPSSPTATFEVATLSAPVAFAGVSVTFADGVTTTTVVPYRGGGGDRR